MSPISAVRPRAALLALAAAVVLAGCSTTTGISAATTSSSSNAGGGCSAVSIVMRSGSVPAPHNYEWTMTLDGDRGLISARGGERGAQEWDREFTADATSRATLCAFAGELAQQDPTEGVGGSTAHAEYTLDGGSAVVGEHGVEGSDVPDRMSAALPDGVWGALQQQLDTWSNSDRTTAPTTS